MNKLDKDYCNLLQDILDNGTKKQTRNGETLSVFGRQIRHKMSEGFPLLTTKKMAFKTIVTELLWFLRGDTNIKYLVDNNCHIWDGDAYKAYFNKVKDLTLDDFTCKGNGVITITGFDMKSIDINGSVGGSISSGYFRPYTQEEFINKIKTDDEFAKTWGELGPIYGKQWRGFSYVDKGDFINTDNSDDPLVGGRGLFYQPNEVDQIQNLIEDLKNNPDSRRLMVTAWNPGQLGEMVLPPCHYGFQVYTRELTYAEKVKAARNKFGFELEDGTRTFDINTEESIKFLTSTQRAISLMWNQRSVDTPLGLPFNIASYGLLLEIISKIVNMVPDDLIINIGDAHIYLNQIEGIKEQLTREPYPLPTLKHMKTDAFYKSLSEDLSLLSHLDNEDFILENYQSHPTIKLPLSN